MAKILVSSGGTREPIDEVRFIANVSTGGTGRAIAEALARLGHEVVLLHGQGATPAAAPVFNGSFGSAEDLKQQLGQALADGSFQAVVMCAAVADYRPAKARKGKIRSDAKSLTLRLVRNPKILPQLKSFSPKPLVVVGFKLTVGADKQQRRKAVKAQFDTGTVDAVVQNDLEEIQRAKVHPFYLYRSQAQAPKLIQGSEALSRALGSLIQGLSRRRQGARKA
jgi:phosphopantothenoylcysteine decarboxylase/phosphopantothenate--cysteine ligase